MLTFNWFFESKPIASRILTQSSRYKRVESSFLADKKGPKQGDTGSCLDINLYNRFIIVPTLYVDTFVLRWYVRYVATL